MKVIYIPVTFPFNLRTLTVLFPVLLASILLLVAANMDSWLTVNLALPNWDKTTQSLTLDLNFSLDKVGITLCLPVTSHGVTKVECSTVHVIFSSCRDAAGPQNMIDEDLLCNRSWMSVAAFALSLSAGVFGLLSLVAVFFLELSLGPLTLLAAILGGAGLTLSKIHQGDFATLLLDLRDTAAHRQGSTFQTNTNPLAEFLAAAAVACYLICSVVAFTLFCCAKDSEKATEDTDAPTGEKRRNTALHPPRPMIMNVDRATTELPSSHARPGFVSLGNDDDRLGDDDLRDALDEHPAAQTRPKIHDMRDVDAVV